MADKKVNLKDASAKEAKAKDAALEAAVTQIERDFGQGSLMRLGDKGTVKVEAIPTGALALDLALGIGGVPRGRIVEIFGPESSGKTTLVNHIIAQAQALGGVCAFIDTEHAIDPVYSRAIGVDTDELLVSQPDYGEQALQIADRLIASGAIDVVAIDSVAALTPKAELDGQIGDTTVGLQARLMSQALRKLAGNLNRTKTVCLFTNQIREKIGVQFGSPETQPGGRALKFYASQRLDIRRIETLKEGTEAVGNRVRVKVVKNKVASPFRQAEFDIEYGVGISREGGLLDFGIEQDLVQKSGSFFSYGETRLGQGRNNAKQFLVDNPELALEIETKVRAALGIDGEAPAAPRPSRRGRQRPPRSSAGRRAEAKSRLEHTSASTRGRGASPIWIGFAASHEQRNPLLHLRDRAGGLGGGGQLRRAALQGLSRAGLSAGRPLVRRSWSAAATTFAVLHAKDEDEAKAAEFAKADQEIEKDEASAPTEEGGAEAERRRRQAEPEAAAKGPGGTLQLAADPTELAFDKTSLTSKPGKVTIDFENPSALEHDVAIEQEGKEIAASEADRRRQDLGQRRTGARHLHLPLHRAGPCRSRHGRHARRQASVRSLACAARQSVRWRHEELPRHHLRVPDERARLRADAGDAGLARLRGGARAAKRPT